MEPSGNQKNKLSLRVFGISSAVLAVFFVSMLWPARVEGPVSVAVERLVVSKEETTQSIPEVERRPVTLLIGGDVMLDRGVDFSFRGDEILEITEKLPAELFQADFAMVNLEGPVSPVSIAADSTSDNLVFNFPPKTTEFLKNISIKAVSLANNHTLNQGQTGFAYTRKVLQENGITPIGRQRGFDSESIGRFMVGEFQVSIITINSLETKTDINSYVKAEKETGAFVIVYPHWGVEYSTAHNQSQQSLAEGWIGAGADVVIGGHPHVIQDTGIYQGKPIIYSLGNFIFDQTFSKETQQGVLLGIEIKSNNFEINFLPVQSSKLQPQLMIGEDKDALISKLSAGLGNQLEFAW